MEIQLPQRQVGLERVSERPRAVVANVDGVEIQHVQRHVGLERV
eukprot:CAMPEP_0198355982 /NCGR_PEP_ID=MMETSP1450-20131203/121198_1 /TAXON_ID=753684 ORGANISM="Madagascaria erythrocladiodes, Strain CCMP3234" /NCGR_SAMPLE_ID=MMETSP1450 /ASSEMBLY_ACC=CAM_ASM_001115 /LENGTH=43 /DNA_ID= /DNA_START= /DNA_END= /DNA_ORIENTATION=